MATRNTKFQSKHQNNAMSLLRHAVVTASAPPSFLAFSGNVVVQPEPQEGGAATTMMERIPRSKAEMATTWEGMSA